MPGLQKLWHFINHSATWEFSNFPCPSHSPTFANLWIPISILRPLTRQSVQHGVESDGITGNATLLMCISFWRFLLEKQKPLMMRSETVIQIRIRNGLVLWIPRKHTWVHIQLGSITLDDQNCFQTWISAMRKAIMIFTSGIVLRKQWLMNCSVKAVLGELSESCWNPEIPVSESVQIDKATLAFFFLSQAQRGPSSPCKWQQPAQKVVWTCTEIAHYIHPRKLTSNPKMGIWMMMFLFERLIFRFHVAMLVFYNIKFMKIPRCFSSFTTPRSTPVRAAETW